MAKTSIPTSPLRLLLNAEPFGFGPTAAIADFFPHLRRAVGRLGYAGVGHTLDLQRRLPYDSLHDISGQDGDALPGTLRALRAEYDVLFTALDFALAEKALEAGFRVCIYDPLTWYWPSIHPVVRRCDLYAAQDFFGVKERLAAEACKFGAPKVVSPIIPATRPFAGERKHVLLNLGGLSNPYWMQQDTSAYARLMVEAFCRKAQADGESYIIAANAGLARELGSFGARNYSREEMQDVLRKAKYAFMTPGLGNIYDAARYATPTIWLPPANDSQGQQRVLLQAHGRLDGALDWSDFVVDGNIDYSADQQLVLRRISAAVAAASSDAASREQFAVLLARLSDEIKRKTTGECALLLSDFGSGGAEQVADLVLQTARKEEKHAIV